MELADVTDSKSVGLITRAGSTPATGTSENLSEGCAPDRFFYFLNKECDITEIVRFVIILILKNKILHFFFTVKSFFFIINMNTNL